MKGSKEDIFGVGIKSGRRWGLLVHFLRANDLMIQNLAATSRDGSLLVLLAMVLLPLRKLPWYGNGTVVEKVKSLAGAFHARSAL